MTHQEKLEYIRQMIVKEIPEIMELKFGCWIKVRGHGYDNPIWTVRVIGMSRGKGDTWAIGDGFREVVYDTKKDIVEILGRPIGIAEILKVIPSHWLAKYEKTTNHYELINTRSKNNEYICIEGRDLNEESEPTIDFLYNLFKKNE